MRFRIIESKEAVVKTQSEVPDFIVDRLLDKAKFKELPDTYSAVVEDFFIDSINKKDRPIDIKSNSEIITRKIKSFLNTIREETNKIDWNQILNDSNENSIKEQLSNIAKELGANERAIDEIKKIEFKFLDSTGPSHAGKSAIVAKQQITRKALDYIKVFPDAEFNKVVKTLTLTTFAHEAGHVVDEKLGLFSGTLSIDNEWHGGENRMERFAESFARLIKGEDIDMSIREQEKLIHIKKVKEMWSKVREYNKNHKNIGVHQLFDSIKTDDEQIKNFLYARRVMYGGNQPENYATPYSLEELMKYKIKFSS